MKSLLLILALASPTLQESDKYPTILSGNIYEFTGEKYLCGTAKMPNEDRTGRYIIAMEIDWQAWEPKPTDMTWDVWDDTYKKICK